MSDDRLAHLEYLRRPSTPVGVANYYVDAARQLGRTTQMVKSLPRDGKCVILLHRLAMKDTIIRIILDNHLDIDYKNIIFISNEESLKESRCRYLPVYVDNSVIDMKTVDYVKSLQPEKRDRDGKFEFKINNDMFDDVGKVYQLLSYSVDKEDTTALRLKIKDGDTYYVRVVPKNQIEWI